MSFFRVVWRLLVIGVAYLAACSAAALVFGLGVQKSFPNFFNEPAAAALLMGGLVIGSILLATYLLPSLVVIILTEAFMWRSVWLYLALGVVAAFSLEWVLLFFGDELDELSPHKIVLASGLVGGFVYWLIAGRNAGVTEQPRTSSVEKMS